MSAIPFHTKVSSCQSSFAVKSTGLIIEHFDYLNTLFRVSFNQLKVVEVNEAPVHFFFRHVSLNLFRHCYSKVWKCDC